MKRKFLSFNRWCSTRDLHVHVVKWNLCLHHRDVLYLEFLTRPGRIYHDHRHFHESFPQSKQIWENWRRNSRDFAYVLTDQNNSNIITSQESLECFIDVRSFRVYRSDEDEGKNSLSNELLSTMRKFGLRVFGFNSPIPPSRKPVTVS